MAPKPKTRKQQRRRAPSRQPRDRILIVCEGEKTEPYYLRDTRQALGIQPSLAPVEFGQGSNPRDIVDTAIRLKQVAARDGNAFTTVYCVFDRDEHAYYDESIQRAAARSLQTIKSVPCFEYWLLLHFKNHTAPYARTGNRSPGQCCEHDLKAAWPAYEKCRKSIFTELQGAPEARATRNAVKRLQTAQREDDNNPTTEVYFLVEALRDLSNNR